MPRAVNCVVRAMMFCTAISLVIPAVRAQNVGSRDLTAGWQVPSEHVPEPPHDSCPEVKYSTSDGNVVESGAPSTDSKTPPRAQREHLEFQIVEISPPQLTIGEAFIATVRLKNVGTDPVLVPATTDGNKLTGSASVEEKTEEKYEVADVSFRLATGKDQRTPIFLTSVGALFADPDDRKTYISLASGNWFDLKLKGVVECGAAKCFGALQPDRDGVLTAWWYQRVLTHSVKGCIVNHGASTVRELDSAPFRVVVRDSVKKAKNGPQI